MKDFLYRIKEDNYYWLRPQDMGRGGATPHNNLCGEAPPKMGTFFTLQVYERVGKFNYAISIYKKDQKGLQMHSMAVKRSRKSSGFEIYSHF